MAKAKGVSIHIGLNHVDPKHYEGWDGALGACVADAKDMFALAKKQGFKATPPLLNEDATVKGVTTALRDAAKTLVSGDLLLLTYSGHGGQVTDTNGDEQGDTLDETWVLFDRQLVDDELYGLWGAFKPGVRILVFSDSCHSGTVSRAAPPSFVEGGLRRRAMPRSVGIEVERAHRRIYRAVQDANPGSETTRVRAAVLLISGCMDNQFAIDGLKNGAFTERLKKVWNGGKFKGSYRRFRDTIRAGMPDTQCPNYSLVGAPNRAFEAEKPFTI